MKTRTFALTIGLFAAGTISLAMSPLTTHASRPATPAGIGMRLDALLAQEAKIDHFNGAVLIRRHGQIVLRRGFGAAAGNRRGIGPDTQFTVPGLTELFTQAAVIQLIEHGKLPQSAAEIGAGADRVSLLSQIHHIEDASHESYATYLQQHIFRPLGMSRTEVRLPVNGTPQVYSTVDDLDRWDQAVLGCTVVAPPNLLWVPDASQQQTTIVSHRPVLHVTAAKGNDSLNQRFFPADGTTITVLSTDGRDAQSIVDRIASVVRA